MLAAATWLTKYAGTALLNLVVSLAAGAAGGYVCFLLVERHRRRATGRHERERFRSVQEQMPELIAEIKDDLERTPLCRHFFVVERTAILNATEPYFCYHPEDHQGLMGKLAILENNGYICDVTPGNTPRYQMSEEFVQLTRRS